MDKIHILDGSWYVFRAYYALPELLDDNNENINAVFWFFRMILKDLHEKPTHFIIAWDSKWKTKRHEIYKEYKANRPSMPDNFKYQIWLIKDLIDELKFPFLEVEWYEADDIINTLVKNSSNNYFFRIISSDKDLKQLLSDNVEFYDPMKTAIVSKDSFFRENWYQPSNIVDYLSLLWDSSDNIPWVRWIWKVWAESLIKKYWDIETIYNNIYSISWSIQTKLIEWKESAFQSKELIKLLLIDQLKSFNYSWCKLNLDFNKIKSVLLEKYRFKSMEKILNELKIMYTYWQQISLF